MEIRETVGYISKINIHRVKSMRPESQEVIQVSLTGLKNDRRYAFVKDNPNTDFPWFTGRDNPRITLLKPVAYKPLKCPQQEKIEVQLPDGRILELENPRLQEELIAGATHPVPIHLMQLKRGAYDGFPISIIGNQTIRAVAQRSGVRDLDARRFRANIEVETVDQQEGAEDNWVGGLLTIGDKKDSPQLFVIKRDERCVMINIHPETAEQTPQVLKDVVKNRGKEMGVYATVIREGKMHVGEPIFFTKMS